MDAAQILFELIRVAVCGNAPTDELKNACTPEVLEQVYELATRHDLAHLAGQGASKLQLADSEPLQKCKKAAMQAFMRHARQEYAYKQICQILEQASIAFIPLKGSVLRRYYPEAWMRTSCDLDILVHEEDLTRAQPALEAQGWKYWTRSFHDLSFLSADGVHLELHFTTIEDYVSEAGKRIMEGIWQDAKPVAGSRFHMEISDPLFYYYHMCHMAKHIKDGGSGIRTFLDVWILNYRMEFDPDVRKALLKKGQLWDFAEAAEALARCWFSGEPMQDNDRLFQQYILTGGTYGNLQNRVSLQQGKKGGKLRFALGRIFQPYDVLKLQYPVLQKQKWLMPVFQVVRWFRLLSPGGVQRYSRELKTNAAVSEDARSEAQALIRHLGL